MMTLASKNAGASDSLVEQAELLERVLGAQLDCWRRALGVIERQRLAMAAADSAALERATHEQQSVTKSLMLLDQQRLRIASGLQRRVLPESGRDVPLSQIISRMNLDDEPRDRILALIRELKRAIEQAKGRNSIVAAAASALDKHISGIQQSVYSSIVSTRLYERRGRLAAGAGASAAVDMKS